MAAGANPKSSIHDIQKHYGIHSYRYPVGRMLGVVGEQ